MIDLQSKCNRIYKKLRKHGAVYLFYYEKMLIDKIAEVMGKISKMVGFDLHCARKMLNL